MSVQPYYTDDSRVSPGAPPDYDNPEVLRRERNEARDLLEKCDAELHQLRERLLGETPFVLNLNDQDVTVAEVPDLPERGLTSLTYDYRQRIQVRSVNDLDGRVLLHEVLHALLRTDPQQICPADDDRHEDFVRMLTVGLHDAAGYRRCHPLAEEAS